MAYLSGNPGQDVEAIAVALEHRQAILPPVVLSELLSDPVLARPVKGLLVELPLLEVTEGYWERAGLLRAHLLGQGQKARLADTLIAQSCLDHDVALVTRDRDFRNFAGAAGLRLLPRSPSSSSPAWAPGSPPGTGPPGS